VSSHIRSLKRIFCQACGAQAVKLKGKLSSDALVVCAHCEDAVATWRQFIERLSALDVECPFVASSKVHQDQALRGRRLRGSG
jgi:hypothetical protein